MKKLIILAVVALCSCKKSHTCKCDVVYSTLPAYNQSYTETINDTKHGAKKTCEAKSGDVNGNSTVTQNCTLQN